jgi:hypothetical protein
LSLLICHRPEIDWQERTKGDRLFLVSAQEKGKRNLIQPKRHRGMKKISEDSNRRKARKIMLTQKFKVK